jgi:TolA-binding protein
VQRLKRIIAPTNMQYALLLAAAVCVLVACASQPELTGAWATQAALIELRESALVEIQDAPRAQQVSALIEQLEEQDREARDAVAAYRQQLLALNADYDATKGEIDRLFGDFNHERRTRQNRFVALWTRFASLTTDEAQRDAVRETAKELKKTGQEEATAAAKLASAVIKTAGNREATARDYEAALLQMREHSTALQEELVQQRIRLSRS